jgi:hypothetical protein
MTKFKLQETLPLRHLCLRLELEEATDDFINEGSRNALVTSDEV